MLAQTQPDEVVYAQDTLTEETLAALKDMLPRTATRVVLQHLSEFWDADATIAHLNQKRYFEMTEDNVSRNEWPEVLEECKKDELAMSSLGGMVWYLRR